MHGGMIGGLFGFGRKKTAPAPIDPNQAQAATTATVESDDFNHHQEQAAAKQQRLAELNANCEQFQTSGRADLEREIAEHQQSADRIRQTRENKNRCDQLHADRLQTAEGDAQDTLKAAQEASQQQHLQCLSQGMGLTPYPQALARDPASVAAATRAQAIIRGQQGRAAALARRREKAGVDPLGDIPISGGRKSRRRRGGSGCGSHKKKKMYAGRKSRRGGSGCGTHKKKMMYAGRKSRRGGARCSPKLKKNCPYYKKYGNHM